MWKQMLLINLQIFGKIFKKIKANNKNTFNVRKHILYIIYHISILYIIT